MWTQADKLAVVDGINLADVVEYARTQLWSWFHAETLMYGNVTVE